MSSAARRSWDSLGPFWPNSNGATRGQGGSSSSPISRWVPNPKWSHLSTFFPRISEDPKKPKLAQGSKAPRFAIDCHTPQDSSHGLWKSPEATRHIQ
ncbi:hypothetical protein O181_004835 [Austropuccinia psidii MF-1]|uniref:Uncharacterized protein n=1 Tax=Austropuccinia psidii MF-1 TaxID=1389203 RepID=A0A9Q3BHT8_9BASI|nr:hypothetical protein [Austropuccinia psidii MF-1]